MERSGLIGLQINVMKLWVGEITGEDIRPIERQKVENWIVKNGF